MKDSLLWQSAYRKVTNWILLRSCSCRFCQCLPDYFRCLETKVSEALAGLHWSLTYLTASWWCIKSCEYKSVGFLGTTTKKWGFCSCLVNQPAVDLCILANQPLVKAGGVSSLEESAEKGVCPAHHNCFKSNCCSRAVLWCCSSCFKGPLQYSSGCNFSICLTSCYSSSFPHLLFQLSPINIQASQSSSVLDQGSHRGLVWVLKQQSVVVLWGHFFFLL